MSSLLVCGTSSGAGKSVVVAGLCRYMRDQGIKVAPFKAQNMSLNSAVTLGGEEIGRAQAAQAFAARVESEAAMNPILIKPSTDTEAQVIVMGRPLVTIDGASYGSLRARLMPVVLDAFESLQSRFDIIICEGAGSLAEFNLRDRDLVNLGFARQTNTPVVVVADIERGGSFAALYGSLALLPAADQELVCGFIMNKFRGDVRLLHSGLGTFAALTGRNFHGVLPWVRDLMIDAEDSLDLSAFAPNLTPTSGGLLHIAVVRLRSMSNFTDFDPLVIEPGVLVRFTNSASEIAAADLVILPGSKSTVADLSLLRESGLGFAIRSRAEAHRPILGVCGGFQMLGHRIIDLVESKAGDVPGLGLLPVVTEFEPDKVLARRAGSSPKLGAHCEGYEIRQGRPSVLSGEPMFEGNGGDEGCVQGSIWGTSWHGVFESDHFRKAFLAWTAAANNVEWIPSDISFNQAREAQAARLGQLIADHADTEGLMGLIEHGPGKGLPVLGPAGVA
jgi:adenosylcobyric acid synthase